MTAKAKSIFWSWDIAVGLSAGVLAFILLPLKVDHHLAKDILGMGISVISIVFSIFFASLTFIISAGSDAFVGFLKDKGHYDLIIWSFRFTLGLLFVSLVYSIFLYFLSSYMYNVNPDGVQHVIWLSIFSFLFLYSITSSVLATKSAIRYAKARAMFISHEHEEEGFQDNG